MDVSSFESNLDAPAFAEQRFPDLSLKHLIARFILARGAVVRATNPDLAEEYVKFASLFHWNEPFSGRRSEASTKAQTPAA